MELSMTAIGTKQLPYTEEEWKIPGYVSAEALGCKGFKCSREAIVCESSCFL
jgi:hypothetical protein